MLSRFRQRTRRSSEREPAVSLKNKSNVIGGWLPSLTLALGYEMKIVATCPIAGRGEAIITDELFTEEGWIAAKAKKKIHVLLGSRKLEFDILAAASVLKAGGLEFLGFIVPFFANDAMRSEILDRPVETE